MAPLADYTVIYAKTDPKREQKVFLLIVDMKLPSIAGKMSTRWV